MRRDAHHPRITHGTPWPRLDLPERRCHMALLTLPAIATIVGVILGMATHTLARHRDLGLHRPHVTLATGQALVLAIQRELGALIVIEVPSLPTARVVTLVASHAQGLLVLVILDVACITGALGILEQGIRVADLALDGHMLAQQGEANQAMVEAWRRFPVFVVVTLRARTSLLPGMLVVLEMAADALG